MTHWTQQWTAETVAWEEQRAAGRPSPLDHSASEAFVQPNRAVEAGDTIYVISWSSGSLWIHGALVVASVVDQATAEAATGGRLYEAAHHALADPARVMDVLFDVEVSLAVAMDLTFVAPDGSRSGPKLNKNGTPDPQAFRAVREIDDSSAHLLDDVIASVVGTVES